MGAHLVSATIGMRAPSPTLAWSSPNIALTNFGRTTREQKKKLTLKRRASMEDNLGHHGCMSTKKQHYECNGIQTNDIVWDTNC